MNLAQLRALTACCVAGKAVELLKASDAKEKKVPTEFRIFGYGKIKTSKGTYTFDEEAAKLVMAAYEDQGNELCFDYEHSMSPEQPPGKKPAAGWFNLELKEDGLYATNVRFTDDAKAMLEKGEYRYFSPMMQFGKDEPHRICALWNLALTNMPATKSMQPLVAASMTARDHRTLATVALGALAFAQIRDALQEAVRRVIPDAYCFVCDVYDDAVIVDANGKLFRIPYEMEGVNVQLEDGAEPVVRTYTPAAEMGEDEEEEEPEEEEESELVTCKAVPFKSGKVIEGKWDSEAAEQRLRKWASKGGTGDKADMDWKKYSQAFGYVSDNGKHFGDFHLPHHDVKGGKLVVSKAGVEAAAGAVDGARGASIPDEEKASVKKHLSQHYAQWDAKAPWDETQTEEHSMKTVIARLSLVPTASEAEVLVALNSALSASEKIGTELVRLTGAKDPMEALGMAAGMKKKLEDREAELVVLGAKVKETELAKLHSEVDGLVAAAITAGQIPPAQKDFWTEQGRTNLSMLKGFIATAPKGSAVTSPALVSPAASPTATVALTAAEMDYATKNGIDPKAVERYKAEHQAAGKPIVATRGALSVEDSAKAQNSQSVRLSLEAQ